MTAPTLIAGNTSSPPFNFPFITPPNNQPTDQQFALAVLNSFQNLVQILIQYDGIASRGANLAQVSDNDPTAILAQNHHRFYAFAGEAIAFGAAISLVETAGEFKIFNATAANDTLPCHGFCNATNGIPNDGQTVGEVILSEGMNYGLSGLTVGATYWLSPTTPGGYTTTEPTGMGQNTQALGFALTADALYFRSFNGLGAGGQGTPIPSTANQAVITMGFDGIPTANQVGRGFNDPWGVTIPASFSGSVGYSQVLTTANSAFLIKRDSGGTITTIGTVTFTTSGIRSIVFSGSPSAGSPGDYIFPVAPATPDVTLSGPSWSILCTK